MLTGVVLLGVALSGVSACDSGGGNAVVTQESGPPGPTVDPEAETAVPPKSEPTPMRPAGTETPGAGKSGEGKPGAGTGGSDSTAPPAGPATAPQLTAALLGQAELADTGLRVDGPDRVKDAGGSAVPVVDRPECAVFAQVSAFDAGAPEAWAHREYADSAAPPGVPRLGITLSSHRDGRGVALSADLDRAMAGCAAGFSVNTGAGPEQWSVAPVDGAPLAGDETVAYRVTARSGSGTRTETVVLVRFGTTTAQFVFAGDAAPNAAPCAAAITGQVRKARALLGR